MSRRSLVLRHLAILLCAGAARAALGCSVCGCGDPLLASSDPAAIAGALRVQLDAEALSMKAGNEENPAAHDEVVQWTERLNAVYRPVDRLALSATLPLVTKDLRTRGDGATVASSHATGLGDVEVSGRLTAWRAVYMGLGRVQELAVSAGTSAPTGPNDARSGGERIDEHGQPGTGSWGPFAGVHYRFEQQDWTAFASLSGRFHTRNAHGYTYGPAMLWSVHGQYFVRRWLVADLGMDGRYAGADRSDGGAVVNTGGTVLTAAPGVYVQAVGPAWMFARAQVPFFQRLTGDQRQGPTVVFGLQYQVF